MSVGPVSGPRPGPAPTVEDENELAEIAATTPAPGFEPCIGIRPEDIARHRAEDKTSHDNAMFVSELTGGIGLGICAVGGGILGAEALGWISMAGLATGGWLLLASGGILLLISLLNWLSDRVAQSTRAENLAREQADAATCAKPAPVDPMKKERPQPTSPTAALSPGIGGMRR
jgi:hypothetical protein